MPAPTPPADDFGVFAGSEHMFFGLSDPFGLIRNETEAGLRRQVPDTVLESIVTHDQPKFLTLGRKTGDGSKIIVTHFGFCVRARLDVTYERGTKREIIDSTLTFLFGDVDRPGSERCRTHFDVHADALSSFDDEVFKARFLTFRREEGDG